MWALISTTKKAIIIIVPCGQFAYEKDKLLHKYYNQIHGSYDKFLSEHVNNGLPNIKEILEMIKISSQNSNKKIKLIYSKKKLNLHLRTFFMRCTIKKSIFYNSLYYTFLFLLPIRNLLNFGKCYRELIYIEFE